MGKNERLDKYICSDVRELLRERYAEGKCRVNAFSAYHADGSAHQFSWSLGDGKDRTDARLLCCTRSVNAIEPLKDMLLMLVRN